MRIEPETFAKDTQKTAKNQNLWQIKKGNQFELTHPNAKSGESSNLELQSGLTTPGFRLAQGIRAYFWNIPSELPSTFGLQFWQDNFWVGYKCRHALGNGPKYANVFEKLGPTGSKIAQSLGFWDQLMAKHKRDNSNDSESAADSELTASIPTDPSKTQSHHPENPVRNEILKPDLDGETTDSAQIVGPYRLLQKIGEGGMGEVWIADQSHPVKRRVALKLIKAGIGSKEILARFEAERQALAMMNHPNIARILDAGATDAGQPYFVMELVQGTPLTKYCDDNRLSIDQRLKLFAEACSGVQHAHQKGIIHRDLKPGNIIVGMQDGKAVPKIIDFGLAKAMESTQRLTDQSLFTGIGQILGTLKYMSPEQASLDSIDIDTRTDIYALGVILYELLTGSTPLDDSSIKGQAALKILEFIRDKEPVKPSSKLGSSTDAQRSAITGQRKTNSVRLSRILAGDLDWVVMKALEKDRTRRYESASGFGADILRYLKSEPVIARPPSLNYRVRKFVRKNRTGVAAASLVMVVLIGGISGTTWGMFRAIRAEANAENRRMETELALDRESVALKSESEQRGLAEKRRREAEGSLAFARRGNEILGSVFSDLDPNAQYATVADLRNALRDNLDKAIREVDGVAIGEPLAVAEMQETLGLSLIGLGQSAKAVAILEKAAETRKSILGFVHLDTFGAQNNLALALYNSGEPGKAISLLEDTLERLKAGLGKDHLVTAEVANNLADMLRISGKLTNAIELLKDAIEIRSEQLGPENSDTLISMNNLALCHVASGHPAMALPILEKLFGLRKQQLGPDHLDTLIVMNNLAEVYRDVDQLGNALTMHKEIVERRKKLLGPEHPDTLTSMHNLAGVHSNMGQFDNAITLLEDALPMMMKSGLEHPDTLQTMNNLAGAYYQDGQLEKSMKLFEDALEVLNRKFGRAHPETLIGMNNLAVVCLNSGQNERAIALMEESLELVRNSLGTRHSKVLVRMCNLAQAYRSIGLLDKALPLFEETLEMMKAELGPDHLNTLVCMSGLAKALHDAGKMDTALELYVETLSMKQAKIGPDHPETLASMNNLAVCYVALGQFDNAVQVQEDHLKVLERKFGRQHPDTLREIANLGSTLERADRPREAIPLLEEVSRASNQHPELKWAVSKLLNAYVITERIEDASALIETISNDLRSMAVADSPEFAGRMANFGSQLLTLRRFPEAESIIRECLEIRKRIVPEEWSTYNTQTMLGGALLGQEKYAEAEPLLLKGYEGMKACEESIPEQGKVRLTEAIQRLIDLYTVTDQPEKATEWKSKLRPEDDRADK